MNWVKSLLVLTILVLFFNNGVYAESNASEFKVGAQLNLANGEVRGCAGKTVYAIPVSKRSTQVVEYFYGNTESGFVTIYATPELIWIDRGYKTMIGSVSHTNRIFQQRFRHTKRAECSKENVAVFDNLKPIEYFLVAPVFWQDQSLPDGNQKVVASGSRRGGSYSTPANYKGGTLMAKLKISPGKQNNVSLEGSYGQ